MQTSAASDIAMPPPELMARMSGTGEPEPEAFLASGRRTLEDWEHALSSVRVQLPSARRLLDWGCGPGRVSRWMGDLARTVEIHAVDIDGQSIAWDAANIPFVSFQHVEPHPPLPFDDGYFDVVVNHSVLTHLDESMQDQWLVELHRVTAEGGTVLLSIHGHHAWSVAMDNARALGFEVPASEVDRLSREGIIFMADDWWTGGPYPDFYHTTYHSPAYVFERWSAYFDIVAFLPRADGGFQDIVILRPRNDPQPLPVWAAPTVPVAEVQASQSSAPPPDELARAQLLIDGGAPAQSRSWYRRAVRRGIDRAGRNQATHQQEIDRALAAAIRQMSQQDLSGHLEAARYRSDEIAKRQAQRMGRLEDQIAALEARLAAFEKRAADS
jgi:SAM-dependent methyltransferase